MFRVKFTNSNDAPIYVQVDPWAGIYKLRKGDEIEIAADADDETLLFDVQEHNDTRILTLWNCDEYFVMREGRPVNWREFPSNIAE